MMTFESKIQGIPCIIKVHYALVVPGSPRADSDIDYYGYSECDYTICDRRGRPAPWLNRKATSDDITRIENEIFNQ